MIKRRRFVFLWWAAFAAIMGLVVFFGVASNPRFETIHMLDVIRLMTVGAFIAVTLMALILFFICGPRLEDQWPGEKRGEESD